MNRPIRRVGIAVVVLMLVLVAQVTYLQVVNARNLQDNPENTRALLDEFSRQRGPIITADGRIAAQSVVVTDPNDPFKYQREYPTGELFAQITGYQSQNYGVTGVEAQYNGDLTGRDLPPENIVDALTKKQTAGTVVLTLRADAQELAREALGGQKGSVVVLEPATGAIVAMYSNPTYDPNPLASHNPKVATGYFDALSKDPNKPFTPRSYAERYPPGSTGKVMTTAIALDSDLGITPTDPVYPSLNQLIPPLTRTPIRNFGGATCGGNLAESFRISCNTTFAQIGLDLENRFPPGLEKFGMYTNPPLDLKNPGAASNTGLKPNSFAANAPQFASAGFGQGPLLASPLQMALVAAAVANGGRMPTPHVAGEIRDAQGATVRRIEPGVWRTAMTPEAAAETTAMMVSVVEGGSGTRARIPGIRVAGKTGTAQQECAEPRCPPHAWFVAFAPAEQPKYAIAVMIERGGNLGDQATGGGVAAPIAAQVLRQLLAPQ